MKFTHKELKETYLEIKSLLEYNSGVKVNSLNVKIAEDLSLWGDDNYYFLVDFIEKNKLKFDEFDYSKHFESEGELFNSYTALIALIHLPFFIIYSIINLFLSKNKIGINHSLVPKINERLDLTFGDLISCKLKGEFCLRKDLHIKRT